MKNKAKKDHGVESFLIAAAIGLFAGLVVHLNDISRWRPDLFGLGFCFGTYVGFAGLPFIDKARWRPRHVICAVLGGLGAVLFAAITFAVPIWAIALAGVAGAALGYLAPKWAPHVVF